MTNSAKPVLAMAIVALAGCVHDIDRARARSEQEYHAAIEQSLQQYREAMERIQREEKACLIALQDLVIRNQYVYGLGENWNAYLYFENGRLVAKQI
jgi:type II secretory pathway pseudopilin PulG